MTLARGNSEQQNNSDNRLICDYVWKLFSLLCPYPLSYRFIASANTAQFTHTANGSPTT